MGDESSKRSAGQRRTDAPQQSGAAGPDARHEELEQGVSNAELARIHGFRRYVAAGRGEIPLEDYFEEMRRDVDAEFKEFWERRLGPKLDTLRGRGN